MHTILSEACGQVSSRYDTSEPYPHGEHVYATNGRILIRAPMPPEGVPLAEGREVPDPLRVVIPASGVERRTVALPDVAERIKCGHCDGKGSIESGRMSCDVCGEVFEIRQGGKPVAFDCLECEGAGMLPNPAAVRVADDPPYYLMASYVGFLRRHGVESVDVPTHAIKRPAHDRDTCYFSGDGFEGWLMPMDTKTVEEDLARAASRGA